MIFAKRLTLATAAVIFGAFSATTLTSCSDDDDDNNTNATVPEAFVNSLKAKYPDAVNVKWETKANYRVAEFKRVSTEEYDVWFNADDAKWAMTEIDYGKDLFLLPTLINKAFEQSEYSTWAIDDISLYQRVNDEFYVFEVEKTGQPDKCVLFNTDGTLIKAVNEAQFGTILPGTVI